MLARTVTGLALVLAAASAAAAGQTQLVVIPAQDLAALPPGPHQSAASAADIMEAPEPAPEAIETTSPQQQAAASAVAADPLAPLEATELAANPSAAVKRVTDWVISSGDNNGMPFMVIDKVQASVFVHLADGTLAGAGPALLGLAHGDDSVPGIGEKKLSMIGNHEKTTPAGRFVANFGPSAENVRVLWIDYSSSVSMHPVITGNRKEKRLQRLKSPTPEDNRITFGCINVFPDFYKNIVKPIFTDTRGIAYVLPETKSLSEVFPSMPPQIQSASQ